MNEHAILLVGETEVLLDRDDYGKFSQFSWRIDDKGYVRRGEGGPRGTPYRNIYLHREIMGSPDGLLVDHRNRDTLDCRKKNLRVATQSQNRCNARPRGGKSRFTGVFPESGKWLAHITMHGKTKRLGLWRTEEEAARVRDAEALRLHGEFARLNFPDLLRAA